MEELILRIYRKGNEVMPYANAFGRVTKGSYYSKDSLKPCRINLKPLQLDLLLFKTRSRHYNYVMFIYGQGMHIIQRMDVCLPVSLTYLCKISGPYSR